MLFHRNGQTQSRTSSEFFRPSSISSEIDQASNSNSTGSTFRSGEEDRSAYARSTISSTSTASRATTRPTTASGRKSRATNISSILGHDDSQSIVCAVSEARGVTPSVGIAFIDVSVGEVTLSQICDNQSYVKTIHKIQMLHPSRIVFMATACPPNRPSTLLSLVQELVPGAQIDAFDRSAWSETAGIAYLQNLAFESDVEPLKVAIQGKFYAISSFSAAMKYIEDNFTIKFAPHSLRINYRPSDDTMMIDISAFQSLEIMHNSRNPKSKDSLFGLLNHTSTPMGTRMLRSNILQPPTRDDSFITPRYEALEELISNEEMFLEIRKALKLFHDTEKLLTKIIIISTANDIPHVEEQINHVLMLKSFLEAVPLLYKALAPARTPLLAKVRDICDPDLTGRILLNIRKVIEADVTYTRSPLDLRNQRTFAVKAGISGMLDVARQTYKELTEEIHKHIDEIRDELRINATLKYDNGRKYWLLLKAADFEDGPLPAVFMHAVRKKDKIECQTIDLVKLNLRLSDTSNEVVLRSDYVIHNLIKELRSEAPHLFRICESVALIDMVSSFGQLATTRDYVKPEITGTLALKAARHPILDKNSSASFIPNHYYATEQYRFHIVTGCNMSGKSIYIRSIALLQIMAQIGSFVPAEYAAFSIIHHIFARVSMDDSIEMNLSTFSVEMREMAFILRNIDDRSLAIIDELGRGTSTRDGLAIAIAMSEALIQSRASVWFATHFIDLARVLEDRPGVLNLHLAATNSTTADGLPKITMLYKVVSGSMDEEEHYGINLARAMGFPPSFIKKAEEVAEGLRRTRQAHRQGSESRKIMARRRLILNLHEALKQANDVGSEEALPGYLKQLQAEFITRMGEVDEM